MKIRQLVILIFQRNSVVQEAFMKDVYKNYDFVKFHIDNFVTGVSVNI